MTRTPVDPAAYPPNLTGDSHTMKNIEGICLPLDNIPEQYFQSYFYLLHEVCHDQQDHTHQLVDIFKN